MSVYCELMSVYCELMSVYWLTKALIFSDTDHPARQYP
jgi:hypothetical protein